MQKVCLKIAVIALILIFSACKKQGIPVSMVTGNAITDHLPFGVYDGKEWRPDPNAVYVKMHTYLDEPAQVQEIEVKTCSNLKDNVSVYLNFDEIVRSVKPEGNKIKLRYDAPVTMRSITFNFNKNTNLCISKVNLTDPAGKKINIITPKIVKGILKVSSQLQPEQAYNSMNLFDSRFEYAYSADGFPKDGVKLDVNFDDKQTITAIKLWNGYQLSNLLCQLNARANKMVVTGDGNFSEAFAVKDVMGSQEIKFSKPFKGKHLQIHFTEVYKGQYYKDLVLSEIRFGSGTEWLMFDPIPSIQKSINMFKESFAKPNLSEILNRSLEGKLIRGGGYKDDDGYSPAPSNGNYTLRLRSDGSFFVEGNDLTFGDMGEKKKNIFGLGNYEVKSASTNEIKIRIFGFLRVDTRVEYVEMDCNGCGHDCNLNKDRNAEVYERVFQSFLTITKKGDKYSIEDTTPDKKLYFEEIEMQLEK